MTIRLLRPFNGYPLNAIVSLGTATEAALVGQLGATYDLTGGFPWEPNRPYEESLPPPVNLESKVWQRIPSLFRLRLVGTGQAVVDGRNLLGEITEAVETYEADGATDQVEFPYLGDSAVEVRVTFPSTLTVQVI